MSIERLYARIVEDTHIWNSPIHGTEHWMRVRDNALYLAKHSNGDPKVVEYLPSCMTASAGTKMSIQSTGPEQPTTQRPNDH